MRKTLFAMGALMLAALPARAPVLRVVLEIVP
jgi:hypothetical protein